MNITTLQADNKRLEALLSSRVSSHRSDRNVSDLARYFDDPIGFMRTELSFEPYDKQIEVALSVVHNKRTVVRGAHSIGKDAILAPVALWAAYARGMLVLCMSATEKQLLGQLWRELTERFNTAGDRLPGVLYTADLRIEGRKRIVALATGSVSALTGWHDPKGVMVIISEGQGENTEAAAFDAAAANATDDRSRILVAGNPYRNAGRFYEVHQKNTWEQVKISAFDHPNVREQREVISGGPSASWPEEMAAEYGEGSPFYIGRVLAEFPDESIDGLIQRRWLLAAYERYEAGALEEQARGKPITLSVDVARFGPDKSVVAVTQGPIVRELVRWRGLSITDTADRVIEIANQWTYRPAHGRDVPVFRFAHERPDAPVTRPTIYIDEPGLGGGAIDVIKQRWYETYPFNGANRSSDPRRLLNLRAESHWTYRSLLEAGSIALPPDADLDEESLSIEWFINHAGQIQILGKDLIRKKLGRSYDTLDSVVIGLFHSMGKMRRPVISFSHVKI